MIISLLFGIILNIFGTIFGVVLPTLPSDVDRILASILQYIGQGLNFVWLFIPKKLVIELFQWWIVFGSVMLTIELALEVWRLITGNAGGQEANAETISVITYKDSAGVSHSITRTAKTHTSSSRHSKLPRV